LNVRLCCFFVLILWANSNASINLDQEFINLLKAEQIKPINNQVYCLKKNDENIQGIGTDQIIYPASISKLFTSLWALESYQANYKFETKLFIKEKSLHIEGNFDPFFGNEKMFFIISELNKLGISELENISFDQSLILFPNVEWPIDNYPTINAATIEKNLNMYFNTASWSADLKKEYDSTYANDPNAFNENNLLPEINFKVKNVFFRDQKYKKYYRTNSYYSLKAPPLHRYLKEMNLRSNNFVAHTLFLNLGGEQKFNEWLKNKFGSVKNRTFFYTGSGLPQFIKDKRLDNFSNCENVLYLVSLLEKEIKNQKLDLFDVMAVPISDAGTLKNRNYPIELQNSFVAKTGTLNNVSTLGGKLYTKSGAVLFGIFNNTSNIKGAKSIQDKLLLNIFNEFNGPDPFNYSANIFHTYRDIDDKSLFSPFEGGLTLFTPKLKNRRKN
jgi:D-alanyl-D-alanine carboxypeptidase/D-alanyl-D-alanine-endopeptidase (penicillin-binding protein 4)